MTDLLRQHFNRSGTIKAKFADQAGALEAAERKNGSGPRNFRAYECDVCFSWHIGRRHGGHKKAGRLQ